MVTAQSMQRAQPPTGNADCIVCGFNWMTWKALEQFNPKDSGVNVRCTSTISAPSTPAFGRSPSRPPTGRRHYSAVCPAGTHTLRRTKAKGCPVARRIFGLFSYCSGTPNLDTGSHVRDRDHG